MQVSAYHCAFILNGSAIQSVEDFLIKFENHFTSLSSAKKSLNIALFHAYLVEHKNETHLIKKEGNNTYFYVSDSNTRWYYIVIDHKYYFYNIT